MRALSTIPKMGSSKSEDSKRSLCHIPNLFRGVAAGFPDCTGQRLDALKVFRAARCQQRDAVGLLDVSQDLQQSERINFSGRN